jgi:hypothetical protein
MPPFCITCFQYHCSVHYHPYGSCFHPVIRLEQFGVVGYGRRRHVRPRSRLALDLLFECCCDNGSGLKESVMPGKKRMVSLRARDASIGSEDTKESGPRVAFPCHRRIPSHDGRAGCRRQWICESSLVGYSCVPGAGFDAAHAQDDLFNAARAALNQKIPIDHVMISNDYG